MRQVWAAVIAAALALGMATGANASTPNLVYDGGFELPHVQTGSYVLYSTGKSFAGWKVVGATGNVAVISGAYLDTGTSFPARSGLQWMDLTGARSNSATGVSQKLSTSPKQRYKLSFSVGNVDNPIWGSISTVHVLINGKLVLVARNTLGKATPDKQVWKDFSMSFVASTATTSISFANADGPSDNTNGLDNVSVVAAS